ncbi:hypothetical protein M405DRAFT_806973 [Rhizopogon salebrosus TDB-379]|nr:hypothetical protein M405DRAFT_806973 [Rhizopogon salebrosus TDB-379]
MHHHETLPLQTSRPLFQHDRCTITVTQGDPEAFDRRRQTYIVASDLSEESRRYAVEWGIGTDSGRRSSDRNTRLRSQQEHRGLAYILVLQAISLLPSIRLQRTHDADHGISGLCQIKG